VGPDSGSSARAELWARIGGLLDRLSPEAARAHAVIPVTVELLRRRGAVVPQPFQHDERAARMANAIAPSVLAQARAAYDGKMMILKGPEVSALYPGRARMLVDLDLLVDDAAAARDALLGAGFVPADRLATVSPDFYHLDPIELPGVPLAIELHKSFRWPNGLQPASTAELFEAAVPASVGVPGLVAPARAHHAVLLAAHAWAERPLERLRDLVDVAVMAAGIAPDELTKIARAWGWDRLWATTSDAVDWLFYKGSRPTATRIWARHLAQLREPRHLDRTLTYWLSPFWALPLHTAFHEVAFLAKKGNRRNAFSTD
jgi:Uncharacterised nucleotidyltransferase